MKKLSIQTLCSITSQHTEHRCIKSSFCASYIFKYKTNIASCKTIISDSYSVSSLTEVSSSVVVRKCVPCLLLQNQPSTMPSLKPPSRSLVSPPTDVEKNCRPSLGYKRIAHEDESMEATTSWKVFLWKYKREHDLVFVQRFSMLTGSDWEKII